MSPPDETICLAGGAASMSMCYRSLEYIYIYQISAFHLYHYRVDFFFFSPMYLSHCVFNTLQNGDFEHWRGDTMHKDSQHHVSSTLLQLRAAYIPFAFFVSSFLLSS